MKMKKILPVFAALTIGLSGCNYLDMVPEKDIETIETIFEKREQAEAWFKSCHTYLQSQLASVIMDPAYAGADEVVSNDYLRKTYPISNVYCWDGLFIGDGLQNVQHPYGDIWQTSQFYTAICYCNVFLEQISKVYNMQDSERNLWIAEMKALKAHYYFELMRRYGPIILVDKNGDPNASIEEMKLPRRQIDDCVEAIVTLLDEAMEVLPPFAQKEISRRGYYSLEAAAALKAQTLFYAASPLFNNPNQMFADFKDKDGQPYFPAYDKTKWKVAAEAIDEAIRLCETNGKRLRAGNTGGVSQLINVMRDIQMSVLAQNFENSEAVFMLRPTTVAYHLWHRWTLPSIGSANATTPLVYHYNSNFTSTIGASLKMVEMYYTDNGLPIAYDKTWDYTARYTLGKETNPLYKQVVMMDGDYISPAIDASKDKGVLNLHLRREPRFYAHIAADRCYFWRGGGSSSTPSLYSYGKLLRPYYGEEFGSPYKAISDQVKQNISGYYIKKGSYSSVTAQEYGTVEGREEGFVMMRLAELYLMSAEAWNEFEGPNGEHRAQIFGNLNKIRARAGIPDVETSWRDFSTAPTMVDNQAGMRYIIHEEWNTEFAFEGRRFWNLRRWLTAAEELNQPIFGWNIMGTTTEAFYNSYNGPQVVWSKRRFVAPRDYLFPINSEEVMVSGCGQNPKW